MNQPTAEDIAAMRADGDLKDYLLALAGRAPAKPAPVVAAVADPAYRITHTGGWPIGTAATGPTPTHGRCTSNPTGAGTPSTADAHARPVHLREVRAGRGRRTAAAR